LGKAVYLDQVAETNEPQPAQPKLDAPAAEWDWDRVDKERRRGLDLVKGWLALDADLFHEFSRLPGS
jgi:hypothetical protein